MSDLARTPMALATPTPSPTSTCAIGSTECPSAVVLDPGQFSSLVVGLSLVLLLLAGVLVAQLRRH
jgi:hypothetical protein